MPDVAIGIDMADESSGSPRLGAGEILSGLGEIARDPERVLTRIIELIENLDRESVTAIGIGVPGRVDAAVGWLCRGLVDLSKIALGDRIGGGIGEGGS